MRVALLAFTIAAVAGSPAFAQCIYVACNNGSQANPVYQAPPTVPSPTPRVGLTNGYDEGYAAGLAARPVSRTTPAHRTTRARPAQNAAKRTTRHIATRTTSRHGLNASNVYGRSNGQSATTQRRASTVGRGATSLRTQVVRSASARPTVRHASRVQTTTSRHQHRVVSTGQSYQDPIKDRAATYRPSIYGQSTTMASIMSSSSSYNSSTITWSGPTSVVHQGGEVCGWGARIMTTNQGYAQRQAVWVCQCPQGWRPPGY